MTSVSKPVVLTVAGACAVTAAVVYYIANKRAKELSEVVVEANKEKVGGERGALGLACVPWNAGNCSLSFHGLAPRTCAWAFGGVACTEGDVKCTHDSCISFSVHVAAV
jgi:hypothetical protein